ncbi:MAG: mechanosensitive ion channel family protein [Thermoplasmata archaeon]|nr:MAG: mechanosensitive ion channel family protein [Thermoplasmata archaeon]
MNLDIILFGNVTLLDLIVVVLILVIAMLIGKAISLNLRRSLKDKVKKEHLRSVTKMIYSIIILIAFILILPILGIDPSGLLVAAGFLGLIIGLASQSVIGNLVAGIFLVIERPMKVGDQVEVEGKMGYVEDVRIMSTIIRTYDGVFVRIPNEKVFTTNISNLVTHVARRLEYTVGIRYKDDADKAVIIIKGIIDKHPITLKNPEPMVFVKELGNSSVDIMVRFWVPSPEWYPVRRELLWKIKTTLEENGIFVPFPQREVWFKNELEGRLIEDKKPSKVKSK